MILDIIKQSRSHRNFTKEVISEEDLLKILECTRYSSNGKNSQELRYSYTIDDEKCKEIFKNISLGGLLKKDEKPTIDERPKGVIAILSKTNTDKKENILFFDIGIVSQNIMLMANECAYSGCIVMAFNKKEVENILNLPEDYTIRTLIVLGKAKDEVEILDVEEGSDLKYFRKNNIHYLPKLSLDSLIIK